MTLNNLNQHQNDKVSDLLLSAPKLVLVGAILAFLIPRPGEERSVS